MICKKKILTFRTLLLFLDGNIPNGRGWLYANICFERRTSLNIRAYAYLAVPTDFDWKKDDRQFLLKWLDSEQLLFSLGNITIEEEQQSTEDQNLLCTNIPLFKYNFLIIFF